jgi:hypothetical protein
MITNYGCSIKGVEMNARIHHNHRDESPVRRLMLLSLLTAVVLLGIYVGVR